MLRPGSGSDSSNIKVVVRVRPPNNNELENAINRTVAKVLDDQILIFDPKEEEEEFYFHNKKQKGRNLLKRENKDVRFMFDHVFDGISPNQEVYENTTRGMIEGLLNGYNCSVFAYGATGAGKTYTMLGNSSNPGLIYLTIEELFRRIEEIKDEKTCEIAVSYLEVYNESVNDLLVPSGPLAIREDPRRGVTITGLSTHKPQNAQALLEVLETGNRNRTQHPTDANAESSRSHAVFMVYVKQRDRTADLSESFKVAKMHLVDLAGSERATMISKNKNDRMREGANINKSLLALGNCINALADSKNKSAFVPYRNSKLTHILKDAIGGNCRTVMIAAISPSSLNYEDTYNTLRYADRAKNIKISLKKNIMNVDVHVMKYTKIVEELRQEILDLKTKLKEYEEKEMVISNSNSGRRKSTFGSPKFEDIKRLKERLENVFSERRLIRKNILELESIERDVDMRIYYRKLHIDRVSLISVDTFKLEQSCAKADRGVMSLQQKKLRITEKKAKFLLEFKENEERLKRVESDCKLIGPDGEIPDTLVHYIQSLHGQVELSETRFKTKHLEKIARNQSKESQKTEKFLEKVLPVVKNLFLILKGHKLVSDEMQTEFNSLVHQAEGNKEVLWEDTQIPEDKPSQTTSAVLSPLLYLPITQNEGFTPNGRQSPHFKGSEMAFRSPHSILKRHTSECISPNYDKLFRGASKRLFSNCTTSVNMEQSKLDDSYSMDTVPSSESPVQKELDVLPMTPDFQCETNSTFVLTPKVNENRLNETIDIPPKLIDKCSPTKKDRCIYNETIVMTPSKSYLSKETVKPLQAKKSFKQKLNFFPSKEKKDSVLKNINENLETMKRLKLPSVSDMSDKLKKKSDGNEFKMRHHKSYTTTNLSFSTRFSGSKAKENHPYVRPVRIKIPNSQEKRPREWKKLQSQGSQSTSSLHKLRPKFTI